MKVTHEIAAYTATGEPVFLFKVVNGAGAYVEFTNWGARWITAAVPDTNGHLTNVIVGYDTLEEYGRKKRAFQNKIETLKSEQAKAEKQQSSEIPPQFVQQASFVLNLIKSPDTAESVKNEALRSIVDHITFKKPDNTLEIFYYI